MVATSYEYKENRKAYKAVREKIRNAMIQKRLDKPAILSIAKKYLDKEYPNNYVDLNDLVGACLYWQEQECRHLKDT